MKPEGGRNLMSAFFSLVVTGLFFVAMAEPNWFKMTGLHCRGHLGMYPIFGFRLQHIPKACFTQGMLTKLQICFALCLLGIFSSMFQFTADVCDSTERRIGLRCLRRNSVGNILSLFVIVAIMGLCYLITVDATALPGVGIVRSQLHIGFYLITGAGVAALVAVTLSLLNVTCEGRNRIHQAQSDMQLMLINEETGAVENELVLPPGYNGGE